MSSSDSDTDPSLPHFETVVTAALVEPDKSLASSVRFTKCDKTSTNSKSVRVLPNLDVIEVLSDHNNNQVNSTSRDFSNISYDSFKNQLSMIQGNGTEELLHPLTSSRVKLPERKPPQKKKIPFKQDSKPLKRGAMPRRVHYNIKKFNTIESSSDDDEDDIYNKILRNIQKQPKSRLKKRRGPNTNKNQTLTNSSDEDPVERIKRPFVVKDIIGYARNTKQDEDFWSLFGTNPDPKSNDALKTLKDKVGTQLESVLEDEQEISTKLKQTFVSGNLTGFAGNFHQDDDYSSLSSLNAEELKIWNERYQICVTSKPDGDGEKTPTDCNHKADEGIPSVQDVVNLTESTADDFPEASCTKFMAVSQDEFFLPDEKLELLTAGKLEKGGKEIFGWIETGIQEDRQDEIFNEVEWQLREISKVIQIKLDSINGPIAVKNYKFYNFLLDLEDKLNTNFRENSDIDDFM